MSQSKHVLRKWLQEESSDPENIEFCGGEVIGCSYRSPTKETVNEDGAVVIQLSPTHGVIAVADGVGGYQAGDRAARAVIDALVEHCREAQPDVSTRAELLDAIEAANSEILGWGIGAATTVVAAEFLAGRVRVIHVGDSTALLTSNHGTLKFLSIAHAPVAQAVALGMLDESEALLHEDRNLISNCVGCLEMRIEVGPECKMSVRDTLLLASDGLFDNLIPEDVVQLIRAGGFETQFHRLIDRTQSLMLNGDGLEGKPDDLTVVAFRQT